MSVTNLSVNRPLSTIMVFVGILVIGYISLTNLPKNLLPDLSYPKISVVTEYPGTGPEEIEIFITSELEAALSGITGIKKVISSSRDGISIITLEFHWGTDMDFALLHTKEKVEEVRKSLPEDIKNPVILEWDPSASPILIAILKGKNQNLKELKETAEFIIKPRLEQLKGISAVEIRGGDEEEISVEIYPEKIKTLKITLSQVALAINRYNQYQAGGTIKKDKYRYTLKIEGEIQNPEQIENIVVTRLENRNVMIKDIGRAFYKNKIKQGDIRLSKNPSIALQLYREAGGNTVNATQEVEKAFREMEKEFGDITFFVISKEAELIIASIKSLTSSLLLGCILAFLILLFFLQNFRDPLFISTVIPISIVATFALMYIAKVNVNIMSLGGLVLGVGMFVDNSIIVLESIFRHRKEKSLASTVIAGTKEVSGAITASTLTTISIFLPVIYLYGITGKLFRDQALTVSFSLISSLIVALTLLPALSSIKRRLHRIDVQKDEFDTPQGKKWTIPLKGVNFILLIPIKIVGYIIYFIVAFIVLTITTFFSLLSRIAGFILKPFFKGFNKLYQSFDHNYHRLLEKILNNKKIALGLSLFVVFAIVITYSGLKKELLPAPSSAKFEITASTAPEYGFEETDRIAGAIENQLLQVEGVKYVFTESGAVSKLAARNQEFSVNSLHFIVHCNNPSIRVKVMEESRDMLKQQNLLNFSLALEKNTLSQYLSTGDDNFQIKVFYEKIADGRESVRAIMKEIGDMKDLKDFKSSDVEGKPLFAISFKDDLLNQLDITRKDIADYINQAVRGEKAGDLKKIQKNYDIYVRVPVERNMEIYELMALPIVIKNQTYHLKDLIAVNVLPSVKEISRETQERYFLISANIKGKKLPQAIKTAEQRLTGINLPPDTRYVFSGEEEERRKAFDSLEQAIMLAILLVYMIMAAQFENLVQPLIIMFTVPMGIIGALLFLLISGNSLNIISGIGIMVLIGIGVNDAIVKIDYSNQLRKAGKSVREAVMQASHVRLRPILMTTFTTIFGLIPMALMSQTGSELQRPLALVIIGGLFFTTFLTLILIPVFWEILENFKEKRAQKTSLFGFRKAVSKETSSGTEK